MYEEDEDKKHANKKNKDVSKTRGEKRKIDENTDIDPDNFSRSSSKTSSHAVASSGTIMTFAQALAKPMVNVQQQSSTPTTSASFFEFLPSRTLVSAKVVLPGPKELAKLTYHFNKNWADYESDEE
jgi:hypothetical protein